MNTLLQDIPETLPLFPPEICGDLFESICADSGGESERESGKRSSDKRSSDKRSSDNRSSGKRSAGGKDPGGKDPGSKNTAKPWSGKVLPGPSGESAQENRAKARKRRLAAGGDRSSINPHLLAARKLSKKIKYLPDHSEAQSETARAICQHLRLLLAATDIAS